MVSIKKGISKIIRTICERKGVTIIEAELCLNHIHMLVEGKSSLMIFDQFANLKYKYGNRYF